MGTYGRTYIHTYKQTYMYILTYIHTYIHTDRHTDIQTYRHTDIQTYRHTDIQTYRHTDIHTYIHTYIYTYIYIYIVPQKNHAPMSGTTIIYIHGSELQLQSCSRLQGLEFRDSARQTRMPICMISRCGMLFDAVIRNSTESRGHAVIP